MKKIVLAYSGGLDTSYCLKKFSNEGFEVHAISVNTGGFTEKELAEIEKNAYKLEVYKRVKLFKSNIDNFIKGKYDLILSNPPYIKSLDLKKLDKDVKDFEPKLALNGGLDGLSEIRKVIIRSTELIKKNGKLIIEIAFNQKKEVKKILKDNGFYISAVIKDLAKNDRCIISKKI